MNNTPWRPWRSALLLVGGLIALSVVAVEPPDKQRENVAAGAGDSMITDEDSDSGSGDTAGDTVTADGSGGTAKVGSGTGTGGGTRRTAGGATAGGGPGTGGGTATATGDLQCKAGQNGGQTATGVSANRIKLAATNVRSGTGSSFLGTAYIGMQAVVNRVNAKGGICGRLLELRLVDDGWVASRGAEYLATFAKEDYFALPVVPSSEGLTQAIRTKIISNAQIPVVGSDGMLKEQYNDPWVWPVATATVSTMRVMAKHAFDEGARTFGIVFDSQYRFGEEGAEAFRDYVKTLPGTTLKAYLPIPPNKPSYGTEAGEFNNDCKKGGAAGCEFVAMLLTPETANTYINSQTEDGGRKQGFGTKITGGAQPLFNERFARDCGKHCDSMLVWTGYNPPVGRLASEPAVAAYVDDVKSVDPGVDVNNQFLEGAYLGMKVFVAALEKAGPRLTRPAVRDAMNSMTYQSELVSSLTWGPQVPTQRFANLSAQAFKIVTASGSFVGFAEANTGFQRDPTPGVVPGD